MSWRLKGEASVTAASHISADLCFNPGDCYRSWARVCLHVCVCVCVSLGLAIDILSSRQLSWLYFVPEVQ